MPKTLTYSRCPKCQALNSDEWPDNLCQDCWEAHCDTEWWNLGTQLETAHQAELDSLEYGDRERGEPSLEGRSGLTDSRVVKGSPLSQALPPSPEPSDKPTLAELMSEGEYL